MTSEEFAKELTRIDAMRLMGAPVYTLAKDYLALQENHKNAKTVLGNIRRALDTQEGCSLTDRAEAVMSELLALREKVKEQKAVEWEYGEIQPGLARALGYPNKVSGVEFISFHDEGKPYYMARWPKVTP